MSFEVYTEGSSGGVYKDGHRMFAKDVIKDLNRKSFLEEKILQSASPTNSASLKLLSEVHEALLLTDDAALYKAGTLYKRVTEQLQTVERDVVIT